MDFNYWGSICLAIFMTLWITDRRRFLNGYFLMAGLICFVIAVWQWLEGMQVPWVQALLLVLTLAFTGLIPVALFLFALACILYSRRLIHEMGRQKGYVLLALVGFLIWGMLLVTLLNVLFVHNRFLWFCLGIGYLGIAYFTVGFLAYLVASLLDELPVAYSVDFIVILGAGLLPNGKVSKILKQRLDKGISQYQKQLKRGAHPQFVVSGGQGPDEIMPESQAMANYLMTQGILADQIIQENKSTSTYENLRNSQILMTKNKIFHRAIFVTNSFHVFRAGIIAKRLHTTMTGVSAPTSIYYLPFAIFREYLALIVMFKWVHLAVLILCMIGYLISWLFIY
ncbi:YdcF family protein [Pediococcus cellicola]|nr:YdcF family protein [Pediococcus cellicola]GEL15321.1 membrane protein [Pediococcus cellicola]